MVLCIPASGFVGFGITAFVERRESKKAGEDRRDSSYEWRHSDARLVCSAYEKPL